MYREKGQVLAEGLIAISVIVTSILGLLNLSATAFRIGRVTTSQIIATDLAAEGLEVVKNIVDSNALPPAKPWNQNGSSSEDGILGGIGEVSYSSTFLEGNQTRFLYLNPATGVYSYDANGAQATPFIRTIRITNPEPHKMTVRSTITWSEGGQNQPPVEVVTDFLDWR